MGNYFLRFLVRGLGAAGLNLLQGLSAARCGRPRMAWIYIAAQSVPDFTRPLRLPPQARLLLLLLHPWCWRRSAAYARLCASSWVSHSELAPSVRRLSVFLGFVSSVLFLSKERALAINKGSLYLTNSITGRRL